MNGTGSGAPGLRNALRLLISSVLHVDWARFEAAAGLRCTIGVAVPLVAGVAADNSSAALFGALGAFGVGFGSFQGAYRSQAIPMLLATVGMAFSVFVGSLAGHSIALAMSVAVVWGFGGGLLVALGQGASFVGLQSIVAMVIAGGFPEDLGTAAARTLFVLGGGLAQTLLVMMIWPLRRFRAERRSLAAVYRSLAMYAAAIPRQDAPPEPHTLSDTASPLADPQPFATAGEMLAFQALLDEAERIRASLAALAFHRRRLLNSDRPCADVLSMSIAHALEEIGAALAYGRGPRAVPGVSRSLTDCAGRLSPTIRVELLLAQLDSAWRTAGLLAAAPGSITHTGATTERRRDPPLVRDALTTLRANLSLGSTAFRHALRLAVAVCLAEALARALELPRGHWLPLTVAVMLKPDFHDTLAAGIARVGGTVLGASSAVAIAQEVAPGWIASTVIVLGFAWAGYAFAAVNAVASTVGLTGYVVLLLTLVGEPHSGVAAERIVNTAIGGALALCAYVSWPTWTSEEMRGALASMLDGQALYLRALLVAYVDPSAADVRSVDELRTCARRARSNAEAAFERTFSEPYGRHSMPRPTAMGVLAANRRIALAALALRAGLQSEGHRTAPAIEPLARAVSRSLGAIAASIRDESLPPEHLQISERELVLAADIDQTIREEISAIVEGVDTVADLLRPDHVENAGGERRV